MTMNGNLFLYRPGGPQGVNVFTEWASLMDAMKIQPGRKILEFDDTFSPCTIQAGTWPMTDVMWAGFGPRPGLPRTQVTIESGAQFQDLRMIGGQITIVNNVMYPAPSPVSDFIDGENHVQIGMRDDCGNTQIVNPGNVPMFNLGASTVIFFVQNCLFGMPLPLPTPPRFHVEPPLPAGPIKFSARIIDPSPEPLNPSGGGGGHGGVVDLGDCGVEPVNPTKRGGSSHAQPARAEPDGPEPGVDRTWRTWCTCRYSPLCCPQQRGSGRI